MDQKLIIGLTGKKGVGKDTSANILTRIFQKHIDYKDKKLERYALASGLKDGVEHIFGIKVTDDNKDCVIGGFWKNRTPREMVIALGDAARKFNKDSIIQGLITKIKKSDADIFIITDIRYDNEAKGILSDEVLSNFYNPVILEITSTGNSKVKRKRKWFSFKKEELHSSEKGIKEKYIDFSINNISTMYELDRKLRIFVNEHIHKKLNNITNSN